MNIKVCDICRKEIKTGYVELVMEHKRADISGASGKELVRTEICEECAEHVVALLNGRQQNLNEEEAAPKFAAGDIKVGDHVRIIEDNIGGAYNCKTGTVVKIEGVSRHPFLVAPDSWSEFSKSEDCGIWSMVEKIQE